MVRVERSGGFAAIRRSRETPGPDLTAAQRMALADLLRRPPPEAPGFGMQGADRFAYRVTIRSADGTEHRFEVPEPAVAEPLRGLLP